MSFMNKMAPKESARTSFALIGIVTFGVVIVVMAYLLLIQSADEEFVASEFDQETKDRIATETAQGQEAESREAAKLVPLESTVDNTRRLSMNSEAGIKGRADVAGYVRLRSGVAVAGAKVRAVKTHTLGFGLTPDKFVIFETKSASDGWFAFERVGSGYYHLTASTDSMEGRGHFHAAHAGDDPHGDRWPCEIILRPAAVITGEVVDPEGRPVPDAWVMPELHCGALVRTDEKGKFTLGPLALDIYRVQAGVSGWAPGMEPNIPAGRENVKLQLTDGGWVEGRITCNGAPVPAVVIRARSSDNVSLIYAEAASDEDGLYRLGPLRENTYSIYPYPENLGAGEIRTVSLTDNEIVEGIDFELEPFAAIAGTVTSKAGKEPIEGVWVCAALKNRRDRFSSTPQNRCRTDEYGHYEIATLSPGEYHITVVDTGHFVPTIWNEGVRLTLVAEETRDDIDFALEPGATVQLKVRSEAGEPIEHANGYIFSQDQGMRQIDMPRLLPGLEESGEGAYCFRGLRSGAYRVNVMKNGWCYETKTVVIDSIEESVSMEFVLKPGFALSGRVLDPGGQGIAGASLRTQGYGEPCAAFTDEDGAFVLNDLKSGWNYIIVTAEGFLPIREQLTGLSPDSDPIELRMEPEGGLTISGWVKNDLGAPVPNVRLSLNLPSGDPYRKKQIYSKEDGSFLFDKLPEEDVYIYVGARYGKPVEQQILCAAGESDVRIVMERFATVSGRVFTENGDPAPRFAVHSNTPDVAYSKDPKSFIDGVFEYTRVHPGRFTIIAETKDKKSAESKELYVEPGGSLGNVVLHLADVNSFSGYVCRYGTEDMIPGASVHLLPAESVDRENPVARWKRPDVSTGSDGRFCLEGIEPGSYCLVAHHPEFKQSPIMDLVISKREQLEDIRLELTKGLSIIGYVYSDNVGKEGVQIMAYSDSNNYSMNGDAISNKEGRFEIKNMEPGDYRITAMIRGENKTSLSKHGTVTLGKTGDARYDFHFSGNGIIRGMVLLHGKPAPHVHINVSPKRTGRKETADSASISYNTMTEDDGTFVAMNLPQGKYHVNAHISKNEKSLSESREVDLINEAYVEFNVGEGGSCKVYGYVLRDGQPMEDVWVSVSVKSYHSSANTDQNGYYEFTQVVPGSVRLNASIDDKLGGSPNLGRKFSLDAGQSMQADLVLKTGTGSIRGKVKCETEAELGRVYVYVYPKGKKGEHHYSYFIEAKQGEYLVDHLHPGNYYVSVLRPWTKTKVANVSSGSASEVNFEYVVGNSTVKAVVTVPNQKVQSGETVCVYIFEPGTCTLEEGQAFQAPSFDQGLVVQKQVGGDGEFEFAKLPAGTFDVVCVRHDNQTTIKLDVKRITLYAGRASTVDLNVMD